MKDLYQKDMANLLSELQNKLNKYDIECIESKGSSKNMMKYILENLFELIEMKFSRLVDSDKYATKLEV